MSKANKTKAEPASVDGFIEKVPNPVRQADAKVLRDMMERLSGEPATMWGPSIIGFGSCHYVYESGREGDMPRIGFSPRSGSLVLYMSDEYEDHTALLDRLGKHKTGVACLYINKLVDVDMSVVETMVTRSLEATERKYPREG